MDIVLHWIYWTKLDYGHNSQIKLYSESGMTRIEEMYRGINVIMTLKICHSISFQQNFRQHIWTKLSIRVASPDLRIK